MSNPGYRPYQPQCQPQQLGDDLWIVDGPEVGYRFAGLTLPCPTRMTVVRIDGTLWLHSPCHYSQALADALAALGPIGWIVAPNSFHHSHVADWAAAYPQASCHLSPDLLERFSALTKEPHPLGPGAPEPWRGVLDQLQVDLGGFVETIFFHRPTASLIVTDLMQNFEAERITNPVTRLILRAGGSTGPGGGTSIDIRVPGRRHKHHVRAAVAQILEWGPARIILSHGKNYGTDIAAEIERAFRWANG